MSFALTIAKSYQAALLKALGKAAVVPGGKVSKRCKSRNLTAYRKARKKRNKAAYLSRKANRQYA